MQFSVPGGWSGTHGAFVLFASCSCKRLESISNTLETYTHSRLVCSHHNFIRQIRKLSAAKRGFKYAKCGSENLKAFPTLLLV